MRSVLFQLFVLTISCRAISQTNNYTLVKVIDSVLNNYHYIEIKQDTNIYQAICRFDIITLDSLCIGLQYIIEPKQHAFVEDIDSLTPFEKVNSHYIDNKLIFKLEDIIVIKSMKRFE